MNEMIASDLGQISDNISAKSLRVHLKKDRGFAICTIGER